MSTNFSAEFINKHSKTILLILYCHYIVFGKKHKKVKYNIREDFIMPSSTTTPTPIEKTVYLFDSFGLYRNMGNKYNTAEEITAPITLVNETSITRLYTDGVFILSSIPTDDNLKEITSRTTGERDTNKTEYVVKEQLTVYQVGNTPTTFSQNIDARHSFRIDNNITKLNTVIKNSLDKLTPELIEKLNGGEIDLQTTNAIKYPFSDPIQNISFISLYMLLEAFTDVIIENLNLVVLVAYILYKVQQNEIGTLPVNIQYIALMFALSIVSVLPKNMVLLDSIFSISVLLPKLLDQRVFLKRSDLNRSSNDYNIKKQRLNIFTRSNKDIAEFKEICKNLFSLNDEENSMLVSLVEAFGINLPNDTFNAMSNYNIAQYVVYNNPKKYEPIIATGRLIDHREIDKYTVPYNNDPQSAAPSMLANIELGPANIGPIWRYLGQNDLSFCPWDYYRTAGITYLKTSTDPKAAALKGALPPEVTTAAIADVALKLTGSLARTAPNFAVNDTNLIIFTDKDNTGIKSLDYKKYQSDIKKSLYFTVLKEILDVDEKIFSLYFPAAFKQLFNLDYPILNDRIFGFYFVDGPAVNTYGALGLISSNSKYLDIYVDDDRLINLLPSDRAKQDYRNKLNEVLVSCTGASFGNVFALTHFLRLANIKHGTDDIFSALYPSKVIDVKENKDPAIELNFKNILLLKFIPTITDSNSIKKYFRYISDYQTKKTPLYYNIKGLPEFKQSGILSIPSGTGWKIEYDDKEKSLVSFLATDEKGTKQTIPQSKLKDCGSLGVTSTDNDYCISIYDIIKIGNTDIDSMLDGLTDILPNKIDKIHNVNPLYLYVILKNIKYPTEYGKLASKTIEKYVEDAEVVKKSHSKLATLSNGVDQQKNAFDFIIKAANYINTHYVSLLNPRQLRDASTSKKSSTDGTTVSRVKTVQERIENYARFIKLAFSNKQVLNPFTVKAITPVAVRPVTTVVAPMFGGYYNSISNQLIDYHFNNFRNNLVTIRKLEGSAPLNGNLIPLLQPDISNMIHGGNDGSNNFEVELNKPEFFDNEMIKNNSTILHDYYYNAIEEIKRRLKARNVDLSKDTESKLDQNLNALKKVEEYTIFYKNQLLRYQLHVNQMGEQQIEVDFDRINAIAKQFYNTREKVMKIEGSLGKVINYMTRLAVNETTKDKPSNMIIQPSLN